MCDLCLYWHQVTILEASGWVGGRVETYRNEEEGWYAELGAMRIPSFHKWVKPFRLQQPSGLKLKCLRFKWLHGHRLTSSLNRILRWYVETLGLKLNEFIMSDNQTFYLVNRQKRKLYEVKQNPDILKYNLSSNERHKSADKLLQLALQEVHGLVLAVYLDNSQ